MRVDVDWPMSVWFVIVKRRKSLTSLIMKAKYTGDRQFVRSADGSVGGQDEFVVSGA